MMITKFMIEVEPIGKTGLFFDSTIPQGLWKEFSSFVEELMDIQKINKEKVISFFKDCLMRIKRNDGSEQNQSISLQL